MFSGLKILSNPVPATIAPELIIHSEYGGSFWTNPGVIIPVVASIILSIAIAVGSVWFWRKNLIKGDYMTTS